MNCLEKFTLPNCSLNWKLISIKLVTKFFVENGFCKEILSNILKSEVDTSDESQKVCGGECGGVCGGM